MKRILLLISVPMLAASLIIVMGCAQNKSGGATTDLKSEKGFVVMELFTSQGCSSCPPADEILGQYARKNDVHIIPLAFHVDYWNRLGWIDSFSNTGYTERQQYYASKLKLESVYTPQIILNGQKEMLGSDGIAIDAAVNDFLKESKGVSIQLLNESVVGNRLRVNYSLNNPPSHANINAALVQADVMTHIMAGENRGAKLDNYNVVRDFKTASLKNTTGSVELLMPPGSNKSEFSVVLFVQDIDSGKITGATRAAL